MTLQTQEIAFQSTTALNCDSGIHIRIALDVGSSTTKGKSALFKGPKKIMDLGEDYVLMPYQKYLDGNGGVLSDAVMKQGLMKIQTIISNFKDLYPESIAIKVVGIATAWARRASNTDEYLKLLKDNFINVNTVSQASEGKMGFMSAALSMAKSEDDLKEKVICDIGGGSFQVAFDTNSDVKVYHGNFGSANFYDSVKSTLGHNSYDDCNRYLTPEEVNAARDLASINISRALESYKSNYFGDFAISVSGIGQFLNEGISQLIEGDCVKLTDIQNLMYKFCDITDRDALEIYPNMRPEYVFMTQTNLIFLESLMKGLNIKELALLNAKTTDFIISDESLWTNYEPVDNELVSDENCITHMDAAI